MITLFIITVLYSRHLSYSDYGIFQSIWMYTNLMVVIMGFAGPTIILSTEARFLKEYISKNKKPLILIYSLMTILILGTFFIMSKNLDHVTLLLLCIFIIIQMITLLQETIQIKNKAENRLFIINSLYAIAFLIWHLYLLYNHYDLQLLIKGIIGLTFLKMCFLGTSISSSDNEFSNSYQGSFEKHWLYLGLNDIAGVFSKWIDKLFLLYLLSASQFAIFFNGSFEIPFFGVLITVAGNILLVDLANNLQKKDKIVDLYSNNFKILSAIVFPIFCFLLFNVQALFHVIFNHKYDASISIFMITLGILPLRINNYGALLQCLGKGNKVMKGSVLDIIVVIVLMLFLYPLLGTIGVAIAVVAGTYCQIIYYLYQSAYTLQVPVSTLIPVWLLIKRLLLLFAVYFLIYFIPFDGYEYIKLTIGGLVTIIIIVAGLLKFNGSNTLIAHGNH